MPALRTARRALLPMLLLAALAGCAAPGEGGAGGGPATDPGAAGLSPSVAAVRAFARICASLQPEAVARQAQAFAFVPLEAAAQAGTMPARLRAAGVRGWIRPVAGAPALLLWNERLRSCELGAGGIDPGEVEREFAAMAAGLERSGLAVTRVAPQDTQAGTLALRQALVVSPRALAPEPPRAIGLRFNTDPRQSIQVLMLMRPVVLPEPDQPTETDDAVPY